MVLLTWYKRLVLSGGSSVEFSTITIEFLLAGASLSPVDRPAGPSGWGEVVSDKVLVELSDRGTI